jgi:hypothetical protein
MVHRTAGKGSRHIPREQTYERQNCTKSNLNLNKEMNSN